MNSLSIAPAVAACFGAFGVLCVGLVLVGLPGAWVLIATAIAVDCLDSLWLPAGAPLTFHPLTILAAIVVAAAGELLELVLSAAGARRFGATRGGMIGSMIGGVIGAIGGTVFIPLPILGTLAGALAGTALGAVAGELHSGKRTLAQTAAPATGAVIGRVLGTLAKLPCALIVLVILAVAAFA